jgi:hypothetical protein
MSNIITTHTRNILFFSCLALCQMAYTQSKTVDVTDPRPVANAVEQLEKIYGWPITYEDPIYVHESQLHDVTEQVQHTSNPSYRTIIPKDIALSFSYKPPSSGPSQRDEQQQTQSDTEVAVFDALKSVLDGYAAAGGSVTFTITEENGVFHVVPTNYLNKEGKVQQMTPILDTKITILSKQRTAADLLSEICQTLTQTTGIQIGVGMIPFKLFMRHTTTLSGSNVTARSLLSQLLAEAGAPITRDVTLDGPDDQRFTQNRVVWKGASLSWQLFYGPPPDGSYALNIRGVTLVNK